MQLADNGGPDLLIGPIVPPLASCFNYAPKLLIGYAVRMQKS